MSRAAEPRSIQLVEAEARERGVLGCWAAASLQSWESDSSWDASLPAPLPRLPCQAPRLPAAVPGSPQQELIQCAKYGVATRFSDPFIGASVNQLARGGALVAVADPVALYLDSFTPDGFTVSAKPAACEGQWDGCLRIRGAPVHGRHVCLPVGLPACPSTRKVRSLPHQNHMNVSRL